VEEEIGESFNDAGMLLGRMGLHDDDGEMDVYVF
jgi:hypothetical protein